MGLRSSAGGGRRANAEPDLVVERTAGDRTPALLERASGAVPGRDDTAGQADIQIMLRVRPRSTWRRATSLRDVPAVVMGRSLTLRTAASQLGISCHETAVRVVRWTAVLRAVSTASSSLA
jgi:hypothetical protein